MKIFKQDIQQLLVGVLDVFFKQNLGRCANHTRRKQRSGELQHCNTSNPCDTAADLYFNVPVPPKLDLRGDLAKNWKNWALMSRIELCYEIHKINHFSQIPCEKYKIKDFLRCPCENYKHYNINYLSRTKSGTTDFTVLAIFRRDLLRFSQLVPLCYVNSNTSSKRRCGFTILTEIAKTTNFTFLRYFVTTVLPSLWK